MKSTILLILLTSFLTACAATHPHLTREQWLQNTTRHYKDISKDDILNATEKLFRLADGDDFKIVQLPNGLYASRKWCVYMIFAAAMGTDYWKVTVTPKGSDQEVTLLVTTQGSAVTPMMTTGSEWTATSMPMGGKPVQGTALYDVFWARLDYLLGLKKDWMDCKIADKRVSKGITWGTNEALCNSFNIKDNKPVKLIAQKQHD